MINDIGDAPLRRRPTRSRTPDPASEAGVSGIFFLAIAGIGVSSEPLEAEQSLHLFHAWRAARVRFTRSLSAAPEPHKLKLLAAR